MTGLTPPPVRWSKRIRIDRCQRSAIDRRCIETASRKFEHGYDLLAGHVEPVHDLVYRGARLEVFKNRRNRHPRFLENPGAAALTGHAFHGGALRPIENSHALTIAKKLQRSNEIGDLVLTPPLTKNPPTGAGGLAICDQG